MTASRPSSLDFWPTGVDGEGTLRGLKADADQFRALLDRLGASINSLQQQKQQQNYGYEQAIKEITYALQLSQKIPDYTDEVVDLATEYAISVHGSGMQMEDDGKLHHAYSISSRQLALQFNNAINNLQKTLSILRSKMSRNYNAYSGSEFIHGSGWHGDFSTLDRLIQSILHHLKNVNQILHSGASFKFYTKEVQNHFSHCIQQIASATSFSRWVNEHNKSAKASNTPLIRSVNFVADAESDEQSRRAFADWMLDQQTAAREIAILDIECKKFLIKMMGSQLGDLHKDKIIALAEGGTLDWSMIQAEGVEQEIVSQLHSALSKHMYETMRLGAPLDRVSKKFLDTTAEREGWDSSQTRAILWEKYKNTGMLRALAQNAKLDLADFFDSVKGGLPWAYLADYSVLKNPSSRCFEGSDWPFNLGVDAEEIIRKTNAYLDDIITDTYNEELDFKKVDNYRRLSNAGMQRMDSLFGLLADEKRRAIFKSQFACVMIKNEVVKLMQQEASGLKSKYDYFRLIARMISFFSPMGKQAGEAASKWMGQLMAGSLRGTSLGDLIRKVSEGGANMSLRGDQIRISDGNVVFYLPTQDEEEE